MGVPLLLHMPAPGPLPTRSAHLLPQMLCSLPYAGVAVVSAADAAASSSTAAGPGTAPGRAVSLLGEALEVLHRRAHNCDLAEQPQPYQVG